MYKNDFTPKQCAFIMEYLVSKNATRAAINAGYSAKTARSAGARLLTNVAISAAIEKGLAEQLERAEVSADVLIQELKAMAFADPLEGGSCSHKLRALELLGKSLGLFQDKATSKPQGAGWSAIGLLPPRHGR